MISLSDVTRFGIYTVKWVLCKWPGRAVVENYGIVQGADVDVISSFFGNVIVGVNGKRIALDSSLAERIKV